MYGYRKKLALGYESAIERVKQELGKEGFGVLVELDIAATLKKKIGVEFGKYSILGACNPTSAYKALQAEKEIGLMLPCNVIVYEDEGEVYASTILPSVAMQGINNQELKVIASEVEEKLKRAIDNSAE